MTPVIPPPRHPYLYSDGVTATIPSTPLSTQIRASVSPVLDDVEAYRTKHGHNVLHQQMERPKDQTPVVSLHYRGNCSHQIKRKTATPEAIFFVFLFHLLPILSFYYECNPSPLLNNYKREAEATRQGDEKRHVRAHTHR
jgi:hypothetical protein